MSQITSLLNVDWIPTDRARNTLIQRVQLAHIFRIQLEVVQTGVGMDPGWIGGPYERDIVALDGPSEEDLRRLARMLRGTDVMLVMPSNRVMRHAVSEGLLISYIPSSQSQRGRDYPIDHG